MATVKSAVSTLYLLLLILGLIVYIKKMVPKLIPAEKTIFIGFALAFVIYFLGMLNSTDMYDGFKRLGKFNYFLLATPVFLLFKHYQQAILKVFVPSMIISGFVALFYLLFNNGTTYVYHSIMYGDIAMLVVGINLLLSLLSNTNKMYKILLFISALCALAASFIVGAKGSWIAIPILFLLFLYLFFTQKHLRLKIVAICMSMILIIGVISITPYGQKSIDRAIFDTAALMKFYNGQEQQLKTTHTSFNARMALWATSIDIVKKHPFFGSGSGDFRLELRRFIKENPRYAFIGDSYGTAHNIFFEWLALFGIVGFSALIIAVFLLPLRFFWIAAKNNPNNLWATLIGIWIILSSMTFGLSETWIVRSAPNGVYVFFVLIFMAFINTHTQSKN